MIFKERAFKRILRERVERGPILRRLREEFFRAASKFVDAAHIDGFLADDIEGSKSVILIFSPFLRLQKVQLFLSMKQLRDAIKRGVRVVIVTRPASKGEVDKPSEHEKAIKLLKEGGVKVIEQERLHFKAIIIDEEIIYIGSINPLSMTIVKYYPPDYMIRFVSQALIDEIIENAIGREIYKELLK